ncbi:MAG: DUF1272 domain-containing protein [Methylobacteriaceae bacterium]|nr:DUF1272 domain-containing protein [Methylobacteriaceae bacterium]
MLELRPNCECCDRDLPPDSRDALICSFECTWCSGLCADQARHALSNCGGELAARPCGPAESKLAQYPASTTRKHRPEKCGAAA